jgi:hypothetical protein
MIIVSEKRASARFLFAVKPLFFTCSFSVTILRRQLRAFVWNRSQLLAGKRGKRISALILSELG